jgi:hypothetical protein
MDVFDELRDLLTDPQGENFELRSPATVANGSCALRMALATGEPLSKPGGRT